MDNAAKDDDLVIIHGEWPGRMKYKEAFVLRSISDNRKELKLLTVTNIGHGAK